MDEYGQRLTNSLLTWGFGLILGVFFGLIVLGWWLWPVQWVDASPEDLLYQYQVDYLTTVIEAYGYTGDTTTAQARYFALGTNGETALAEIVQNPGTLPPLLLSQFSEQVAGVPMETLALQPVEVPKSTTGLNSWIALLFGLLFIALGAVVTYLILRGREQEAAEVEYIEYEAAPVEPIEAAEYEAIEASYEQEATVEQVDEEVQPAVDAGEEAEEDWYHVQEAQAEISSETEADAKGMDLPPFIAAAGAAAVAATAAGESAAEESEQEQEIMDESLVEAEIAEIEEFDESPDDSSEALPAEGAAMAGLADAWLAEEEAEEELEPEEEFAAEIEEEQEIETPEFGDLDEEDEFEEEEELEETEAQVEVEVQEDEEEIDDEPAAEGEQLVNPHDPIEVKMRKKLQFVEGIGDVYSQKLAEVGILTTGKLMVEGVTRTGRQELAEKTGISEKLILKWLNEIDLYRIKGIGSEYADLLESAGVDTVPELAQRNPDNLYQALANTNQEKNLVRQLPTQDQVKEWVEQAKQLPRIIQY